MACHFTGVLRTSARLDYKLRHSFFYMGSVSIKFLSVLKITLAQVIEKST